MIPYGNYRRNDDGEVVCQHGETECYMNRVHACMLRDPGGKRALNATVCTIYHNTEPKEDFVRKCIQDQDRPKLDACMEDASVADEYLARVDKSPHRWGKFVRSGTYTHVFCSALG
eukprot:Blabericola_migrator_1__8956@NODE_4754_length_994_cov_8_167206_g2959_i0_p3_GENE_NODE_4754_length_994_cov_8_167206_g2959_i0NODE_4754_length_994_cov_8_167206_g2959_i0_p3_ORF_typecomplete_len116_score16_87GILT/PF03227_16/1_6e12GILT/PF03227_16/6_2e03Phage_TAC_10/PF10963_8/0_22_NODE_4754_length_994_cov_8_167206_g2959_i037384